MDVVKVSHLSKRFSQVDAVSDLSFTVSQADVYGFLGQNGAGKSTTIRMLLSLVAPSAGDIELFGLNLRTHRKQALRQVGAVIERPDLYRYFSAYENLQLFARMNALHLTRAQLMDRLEMVGLAERAHSRFHTYSQGMKQRLGIAIALVHDPQLVILDEPVNGLDPQGIADIRHLILHLSREMKKTVLISSHLLSEMEQIATRMLIIDKGKKIVEGRVDELFDPSKTIVEIDVAPGCTSLDVLGNSSWASSVEQAGSSQLLMKVHHDQLSALNRDLVQMGIPVMSFKPVNSLERYFLSLTGNNQHVAAYKD